MPGLGFNQFHRAELFLGDFRQRYRQPSRLDISTNVAQLAAKKDRSLAKESGRFKDSSYSVEVQRSRLLRWEPHSYPGCQFLCVMLALRHAFPDVAESEARDLLASGDLTKDNADLDLLDYCAWRYICHARYRIKVA